MKHHGGGIMKIRGVIFDLDGVICSTDAYHFMAWKAIAKELGVTFDEKQADRLRGVSRRESLEIVLETYTGEPLDEKNKAEWAEKKNHLYRKYLQNMTTSDLSDEVFETLEILRERGLKLAIGSSSRNTPLILNRLGLENYFDAVADGNCIVNSKPAPEVFLKAAEMLRLSPAECLVVEDADSGIRGAWAGGFRSAGLGPAAACPLVTYPLTHFSDLLTILSDGK